MKTSTLPRQQHKKLMALVASREDILLWVDQNGCLVIGIGVLKGGTGKTTSTIFLALYLAIVLGLTVAVIDTDDNSQTVDNWYRIRELRDEVVPFDLVSYDPKDEDGPDLDDVIEELKETYQVVIVDSGGAGKETYWEMCRAANLVILPVAPSGYEISRIKASLRQAAKGTKANPGLLVSVFLVKCSRNNTLADEQRPVLEVIVGGEDPAKVNASLVPEEFQISGSTDYPRSWEKTPKRAHLDEFGMLLRHLMKGLVA
ncbi:ParA family protein [Streptomyces sp. NBC_01242]|uniref:ParA family protein n=1 Tax=Streptomyces sp. NBC_01242 TaxID=2903795 RepID=UPI00224F74CB|nr:ParA family protein [Streptomyces sp. NBC_01242]MCX4799545.1 ParA family protein [Streptomyces sp. NBC_01242]